MSENGQAGHVTADLAGQVGSRYTDRDCSPTARPRPKTRSWTLPSPASPCLAAGALSGHVAPARGPSLWEPPVEDNLGPTWPTAPPPPWPPTCTAIRRCGSLRPADIGSDCPPGGLGGGQEGPRRPALHRPARPGGAGRRPSRRPATLPAGGPQLPDGAARLPSRSRRLRDALATAPGERGRRHRQGGGPAGRHRQPQAGHRRGRGRRRTGSKSCRRPRCLPFPVERDSDVGEEARLTYRYLDMRRGPLIERLAKRARFCQLVRSHLSSRGFLEVQTPVLTVSSPEGARDYLVPSRLYPGEFYALPQAPQQFKQLLMVGGVERYFQIAPCFRDEASRADRSPGEFYQIDLEMAFATQEDVFHEVELLFHLLVLVAFHQEGAVTLPPAVLRRRHGPLRDGQARPALRARDRGHHRRRWAVAPNCPCLPRRQGGATWSAPCWPRRRPSGPAAGSTVSGTRPRR